MCVDSHVRLVNQSVDMCFLLVAVLNMRVFVRVAVSSVRVFAREIVWIVVRLWH
jgi:hypothetical protein